MFIGGDVLLLGVGEHHPVWRKVLAYVYNSGGKSDEDEEEERNQMRKKKREEYGPCVGGDWVFGVILESGSLYRCSCHSAGNGDGRG